MLQLYSSAKEPKIFNPQLDEGHLNVVKYVQVYENALEVASSIIMYEVYAQFLKELSGVERSKYKTANVRQNHSEEERYEAATLLLQLYSRAKEANVFSPCLAEGHVNVLLNLGKLDTARQVLEELCSGNFRTCARLWTMRIVLEMKRETRAELPGLNRLADLCESCLKQIPMSEAQDIWAMVSFLLFTCFNISQCHKCAITVCILLTSTM